MVSFENDELITHFIYCGDYYKSDHPLDRFMNFKKMFVTKMEKFGIQSSILTILQMERRKLITKEKAKEASEGKLINEKDWEYQEISINDDLEMFFTNFLNSKEINRKSYSFFTPKLTKEELKLVEVENEDYLETFDYFYPDVDPEEMKKSDSKSKYVHGVCDRETYSLTL